MDVEHSECTENPRAIRASNRSSPPIARVSSPEPPPDEIAPIEVNAIVEVCDIQGARAIECLERVPDPENDEHLQAMVNEVREQLEKKQNEAFSEFVVVDSLKNEKNTFVKVIEIVTQLQRT